MLPSLTSILDFWVESVFISGVTGGSWGKEGNKSKGGYQDNSDEDDNAHRGYSPEPASEYRDNEGIVVK